MFDYSAPKMLKLYMTERDKANRKVMIVGMNNHTEQVIIVANRKIKK